MTELHSVKRNKKRVWKKHMEKTMNKNNAWDQKTEIGIVEGPVEKVSLEKITNAMKKMKLGKAFGLSEVSIEMINASGKVEIDVMMKFCQRALDKKKCQKIGQLV